MPTLRYFFLSLPVFLCFIAFGQKKIKPGDRMPETRFLPVFGDSAGTQQLRGKKVLFMFNRYVSCPLCNFRAYEILSVYDTLKKYNLEVVSVYESSRESLTEYTKKEDIPFIMVADPEEKLYTLFAVRKSGWRALRGVFHDFWKKRSAGKKLFKSSYEREGSLSRIGADFLIDENGIVRVVYYGKYAGDHLPVEEILKWVKEK